MRRNFAQVLREGKIDIENEYHKLYDLFYNCDCQGNLPISYYVDKNFLKYPFRDTCLTLEDFEESFGFIFEEYPQKLDIDYLINFLEFIYNLMVFYEGNYFGKIKKSIYIEHILCLIEKIGYMEAKEDDFTVFVPKDSTVIAVSESTQIPDNFSYKLLEYTHHSSNGNLEQKKEILIKLSELLEAKRETLDSINSKFTSDLFMLINKCNIRHNNIDKNSSKYVKYIAEMKKEELEHTYDEIYQMCLLAFMQLEHHERGSWLKGVKDNIVNVK